MPPLVTLVLLMLLMAIVLIVLLVPSVVLLLLLMLNMRRVPIAIVQLLPLVQRVVVVVLLAVVALLRTPAVAVRVAEEAHEVPVQALARRVALARAVLVQVSFRLELPDRLHAADSRRLRPVVDLPGGLGRFLARLRRYPLEDRLRIQHEILVAHNRGRREAVPREVLVLLVVLVPEGLDVGA